MKVDKIFIWKQRTKANPDTSQINLDKMDYKKMDLEKMDYKKTTFWSYF